MAEKQKNCYVVRVEDPAGYVLFRTEYVGGELGFRVWYNLLRKTWAELRKGKAMHYPYYYFPVTEG